MTSELETKAGGGEAATVDPAPIRLLAAEDNVIHQLLLKTLLHQLGLELTLVENGKLAVDAWRTGDWDLILMDIAMPEMDGTAAARAIRALEAKTGRPRTAIIAVTADMLAKRIAEDQEAGIDARIGKPVDAAALYRAIEAAIASNAQEERALTGVG